MEKMKEKIDKTLAKTLADIQKAGSQNTSTSSEKAIEEEKTSIGDPSCLHCKGTGFVRLDVPFGHSDFGRLHPCECQRHDVIQIVRNRLFNLSNLDALSHLTFENFNQKGNKNTTSEQIKSLVSAFEKCRLFSQKLEGWLFLQGGYGCGKTHLAAAIANFSVSMGVPTLFITVPDLLDTLRFAYNNPETTFEEKFNEIRNANLLVLDDFGTQNATAWAQEKLFQILNYRYINHLPIVITTNLALDSIEGRIRSRLQDNEFVKHISISAPDYRRPFDTSNPGVSSLYLMPSYTFRNFNLRDDELGKTVTIKTTVEKKDGRNQKRTETNITTRTISSSNIKTLNDAFEAAATFAENPRGWLIFLGNSWCGKTHLAAAIGNYYIGIGGKAILVSAADLLDYLRAAFDSDSAITYNSRFYEVRTTPLLILDALNSKSTTSSWSEEKLHQILNHRYLAKLPTIITTSLDLEDFETSRPSLLNKMLDTRVCQILPIEMPPYRYFRKNYKQRQHSKSRKK